jgi:hypothetical protein
MNPDFARDVDMLLDKRGETSYWDQVGEFRRQVGAGIGMLVGAGPDLAFGHDPSDAVMGAAMGLIFGPGAGLLFS